MRVGARIESPPASGFRLIGETEAPDWRDSVGVIDIGSNSVRLVVFDGTRRVPVPMFNEKVLCGLGRGLGETGHLADEPMDLAMSSLRRFVTLARRMRVGRLDVLATAALREAENGPAFRERIQRACGVPVRVLSGADEARLSGLGVISGSPDAEGVMGDLGGGSLELVSLHRDQPEPIGDFATLPIGPLRLIDAHGGDMSSARRAVASAVAEVSWLADHAGCAAFYPVGGSWRGIARLHMGLVDYPLTVIHDYTIPLDAALEVCQLIQSKDRKDIAAMDRVPRRRADTLPYAASALEAVLRVLRPRRVRFSAFGLREGVLFDRLPQHDRRKDPLIAYCALLARQNNRFGDLAPALTRALDGLFPRETESHHRLRYAAALLADIAWRDHPDYRAEAAFLRVLHTPFIGIDHAERAHLAITLHGRYGGGLTEPVLAPATALLPADRAREALTVGLALRLCSAFGGAVPEMLDGFRLERRDDELLALVPKLAMDLAGGAVERRLKALSRVLDLEGRIVAVEG